MIALSAADMLKGRCYDAVFLSLCQWSDLACLSCCYFVLMTKALYFLRQKMLISAAGFVIFRGVPRRGKMPTSVV